MDRRIELAAGGDANALAALLFEHHDDLQRFVFQRLPGPLRTTIDADDLIQMVFVDAFRGICRFQPKSDRAFYRWLEVIAENRLTDTIRTHKAIKRGGERRPVQMPTGQSRIGAEALFDDLTAGLQTPSRQVARKEGVAAMQVHLAALPEEYRKVILLRHFEGLSRAEVAKRMNRTVDEVRGLLFRARTKLRNLMGNESDYFTKH